jgi:hypothetical protein
LVKAILVKVKVALPPLRGGGGSHLSLIEQWRTCHRDVVANNQQPTQRESPPLTWNHFNHSLVITMIFAGGRHGFGGALSCFLVFRLKKRDSMRLLDLDI